MDILRLRRSFARNQIYEKEYPFKKFTPIKKINMQQLTNAEEQVMEHLWKLDLHERLA
jgi:hypothetical protein